MIHEVWVRHVDGRRLLSMLLAAVAWALVILSFAAAPTSSAPGSNEVGELGRYSAVFGGTLGLGIRAYLVHRRSGARTRLLWAIAQGGSMALLFIGTFSVAAAVRPIVGGSPAPGGDAWLAVMAAASVTGLTAALLWERIPQRQRMAATMLLAAGFIISGLLGLRSGDWWAPIGALSLLVGTIAIIAAVAHGFAQMKRDMTETPA